MARIDTRQYSLENLKAKFKTLPTGSATIEGFEVTRMARGGHCLLLQAGTPGDERFVNRLFRLTA